MWHRTTPAARMAIFALPAVQETAFVAFLGETRGSIRFGLPVLDETWLRLDVLVEYPLLEFLNLFVASSAKSEERHNQTEHHYAENSASDEPKPVDQKRQRVEEPYCEPRNYCSARDYPELKIKPRDPQAADRSSHWILPSLEYVGCRRAGMTLHW